MSPSGVGHGPLGKGRREHWTASPGLGLCLAPLPLAVQFRPVSPSPFLGCRGKGTWLATTSWGGAEGVPASLFSPSPCF